MFWYTMYSIIVLANWKSRSANGRLLRPKGTVMFEIYSRIISDSLVNLIVNIQLYCSFSSWNRPTLTVFHQKRQSSERKTCFFNQKRPRSAKMEVFSTKIYKRSANMDSFSENIEQEQFNKLPRPTLSRGWKFTWKSSIDFYSFGYIEVFINCN